MVKHYSHSLAFIFPCTLITSVYTSGKTTTYVKVSSLNSLKLCLLSELGWRKTHNHISSSHFKCTNINLKWALDAARQSYYSSLVHSPSLYPKQLFHSLFSFLKHVSAIFVLNWCCWFLLIRENENCENRSSIDDSHHMDLFPACVPTPETPCLFPALLSKAHLSS